MQPKDRWQFSTEFITDLDELDFDTIHNSMWSWKFLLTSKVVKCRPTYTKFYIPDTSSSFINIKI